MRTISLSGFLDLSWLLRGELGSCSFWTNCWTALVVVPPPPRLPEPRPVVGLLVGCAACAISARAMVRIGTSRSNNDDVEQRKRMRGLLGGNSGTDGEVAVAGIVMSF